MPVLLGPAERVPQIWKQVTDWSVLWKGERASASLLASGYL